MINMKRKMNWQKEKFSKVVNDITGGNPKVKANDYLDNGASPIIDQGADFIGGYTNQQDSVKRNFPVVVFGDHSKTLKYIDFDFCLGADGVKVLEPKYNNLHSKFLYYYLMTIKLPEVGYSRHFKFLKEIEIPLPPIELQKKIADILDKADALRRKDAELIKKYDELAQSIFIEMFGNFDNDDKRYKTFLLGDIAEVANGVTKNNRLVNNGMCEADYLRVANVQDGYLDLTEIKQILVSEFDYAKYQLIKDDILLTEGGDPDKLGRGSIWSGEIEGCIYQNHLFRVRVNKIDVILPRFLVKLVSSSYGKKYFLKAAKQTTGIATINSTQLKNFPVKVPDLALQKKFVQISNSIEVTKSVLSKNINFSEQLFQSLLQRAFNGELVH